MSHFTRIKTQLRNMETLEQALADLGYETEAGAVRGYGDQQADADLVVKTDSEYNVGFKQQDGNITMIADFWGLKIDRKAFLNNVSQRYAYLTVKEQADTLGWQTMTEEVMADGSIRLVMQRWE